MRRDAKKAGRLIVELALAAAFSVGLAFLLSKDDMSEAAKAVWVVGVLVAAWFLRWRIGDSTSGESTREGLDRLGTGLEGQVASRSYNQFSQMTGGEPLYDLAVVPRISGVIDPALRTPNFPADETVTIVSAFDSTQGRLLVVGEPGSGKTMAVYQLIRALHQRGQQVLLVDLASWQPKHTTLEDFLIAQLCDADGYAITDRSAAAAWIKSGEWCLAGDGLNELGPPDDDAWRVQFLHHLTAFVRAHPKVQVVLTCRLAEWERLAQVGPLVGMVQMEPLNGTQIDTIIARLSDTADREWRTVAGDAKRGWRRDVRAALANPLFASLALSTRPDTSVVRTVSSSKDVHERLISRYITATLPNSDDRRWAGWIARFLNGDEPGWNGTRSPNRTVFSLSGLTPPTASLRHRAVAWLVIGLVIVPVFGMVDGLLRGRAAGPRLGLAIWLPTGLTFGLSSDARPRRSSFSIGNLTRKRGWILMPIFGLFIGLISGLHFRLPGGLIGGLVFGLTGGLAIGLTIPRIAYSQTFSEPLTASRRSWLAVGLAFGMVIALFIGLGYGMINGMVSGLVIGSLSGLAIGPTMGVDYGGWFVSYQHFVRRWWIRTGTLPRDLPEFIDSLISSGVMRPTGTGVRFRHDLIQQHLAQQNPKKLSGGAGSTAQ